MKILIDTREKTPWLFKAYNVETERATLTTGDYSVAGLEDKIAIERKTFTDFLGCLGHGRDRFRREMHRMKAYETRAVIIEATYSEIASGLIFATQRGNMVPNHAIGMIESLTAWGIPVPLPGALYAEMRAFNIMRVAYNQHVKKAKAFAKCKEVPAPPHDIYKQVG